ncbi:MAG: M24 family metallopeptidase [Candidatus Puniceispirillum sp.]
MLRRGAIDKTIIGADRKIDLSRHPRQKPDGTPDDNDRVEIGSTDLAFAEWKAAGLSVPNMAALRAYRHQRYAVLMHGVGLCDEYPAVRYEEDVDAYGYGGCFEEGMTLSVEAYVGAVDGSEGVKLEEQVLVTQTGAVALSHFPYEDSLLA